MKKLRIALVLNRFYPEVGGAETNLYFQACELAVKHDVTVFTPRRLAETAACECVNGVKIRRLRDWRNVWRGYPNLRADTLMPGIFFRILFGRFDVVQAFPALNHNNMLALLAAKLRGIAFILCSFDLLDYARIEREQGHIDLHCLDGYVPSRLRRWFLARCDHIFAISNREMAVFRRYNAHVSYSPVPIHPAEYAVLAPAVRPMYKIAPDAVLFLVLGRVSRLKGQDLAVRAFLRSAGAMPGSVMVLVGRTDYEPELSAQLRDLISAAGMTDRVIFTGMVARETVIGFLQQSSVHVIPVRFMNSGAVVVESWAGGIPVIQSDAVDPNLVKPGENGYLFATGDLDALAACLREAYAAREQLPALGAAGRERVYAEFTYERLVAIYEEVYRRVVRNVRD